MMGHFNCKSKIRAIANKLMVGSKSQEMPAEGYTLKSLSLLINIREKAHPRVIQ